MPTVQSEEVLQTCYVRIEGFNATNDAKALP